MEYEAKQKDNTFQKAYNKNSADVLEVDSEQNDKRTKEGTDHSKNQVSAGEKIYVSVGKIDMYARSRRKISILAHKLKRLSHEGNMDKFNEIVIAINDRCVIKKLKLGMCVRSQMEVSDIRITALDAQIEARRLKYDTSLTNSDIFVQMERLIVFTSNPIASSMTYLARLGSALSMKTTLDNGLAYLQYAKQHSEHILPCKDTGMVYYIKANLLSQKYELNPTAEMKEDILKTIRQAMSQFQNETDDIRKDYDRMLLLKMAYCYLGLNLFGKNIKDASVSDEDRKSAKKCLDFIESQDIWERMESRRKMLYHIAKAEYYRQEHVFESSKMHAKIAEKFAQENSWTAELPNINDLIRDIDSAIPNNATNDESGDSIIEQLFSTIL